MPQSSRPRRVVSRKKLKSVLSRQTKGLLAHRLKPSGATSRSASNTKVSQIRKRDGSIVPFDAERISRAVFKAMRATGEGSEKESKKISQAVVKDLILNAKRAGKSYLPVVEEVQDLVEEKLILANLVKTSKAYILYRQRRAELRRERGDIPQRVKDLVEESNKYFRSPLGEFVYYRTYSRWISEENRRETWIETVDRYMSFMKENLGDKLKDKEYDELRRGILNHEAMPSMRLLQFAGKAARATHAAAYNCSYVAPRTFQDFGEIMYLSMCGTGVGWSVESSNIQELPIVKYQTGDKLPVFIIPDSKEGWCEALVLGLKTWFEGRDVDFDFSKLRPAGARLMTMGGKSSGPEPLRALLVFTRDRVLRRQGKRLSNIDAHDIICKIGEVVVSGGVRRTAMISLSDLDDTDIRDAKKGQFYLTDSQRSMANNSAVYNQQPTAAEFLDEWTALIKSGTGERGVFNRGGLKQTLPERRMKVLGGEVLGLGTNPCGEIILQSKQFCNLSEVVARPEDTVESLARKMRLAVILGTYQSTLTNFPYLSREWKINCEKERLLGVSITGQFDCPAVQRPEVLKRLKEEAIKVNHEYAKRFNINESTAITCTKPSGNLSQTVDSASGLHPRFSPYYIRRVRIAATDSLFKMLRDQGVPYFPEVGQTMADATTFVIEFPVKSPSGATFKNDVSAIEQLEYWRNVKENFTEHNPSVTVSIGDNEWVGVADWLYKHWNIIGGLSFLPRHDHVYRLAPYEEIDAARYKEMLRHWEGIDFSKIMAYEREDGSDLRQELACAGGTCEIDSVNMEALKKEVK